jgi:hypothetical protein
MAITKTVEHTPFGTLVIFSQTSAASTAQTCSTDALQSYRVLLATCKYSAAPTQTGVITTLNSGIGAAYDTALNTGTANAQVTAYQPSEPLIIAKADAIDVLAPAAGGVITSAVLIYCLVK